jgi:DNA polymerase elongation subunit (family B)
MKLSKPLKYNHVLMGDTDSSYVRLDLYAEKHGVEQTIDNMVELADRLQKRLETELPAILSRKFMSSEDDLRILKPGRETVGRRALFKDKKKRYAIHVVDSDGRRVDKVKVMGMETRRSDTPAFIQEFLSECIELVVKHDKTYDEVKARVDEFRKIFRAMPPWQQISPGRVKNLSTHTKAYRVFEEQVESGQYGEKLDQMHFTVKAALNTNRLIDHYGETRWDNIHDGDKVGVIYLLPNPEQMDTVAIRTGELYIPEWFSRLPFDVARMEEKLLDKKLFNVIGDVLGWDFTPPKNYATDVTEEVDDFYD